MARSSPPTTPVPSRRRAWWIALALGLLYLVPSLFLLDDFGPTFDCVKAEYPYGERVLEYVLSGDERFLELRALEPRPTVREPHPRFEEKRYPWFWVPPFVSVLSAISCRVFWTEWNLLPPISAHHLVIPLMMALMLCVWSRFLARRIGALAAIAGALALMLQPRFFAHSLHNLKDAPEASLYVLAMVFVYLALTRDRRGWWIWAGVFTGLALAHRPNALFIPVQALLFFCLVKVACRGEERSRVRVPLSSFLIGSLSFLVAYYAASPPYWSSPIEGPREVFAYMFRVGKPSMTSTLESDRPWWRTISMHAPHHVLWTTPPAVLVLAALGILRRGVQPRLRIFLLAGLIVPVARFFIPGMRNYSGVRHFLEFFPFLSAFAGLGVLMLVEGLQRVLRVRGRSARLALCAGVVASLSLPSAIQLVRTYPNGICYFNSILGGLGAAQKRRIREATDYWGNSLWQGADWLNEHAARDAVLVVPDSEQIAQAIAAVKLRPDIRMWTGEASPEEADVYVMYVTYFRGPLRDWMEANLEAAHEINVQGGTILRIFRLPRTSASSAALAALRSEGSDEEKLGPVYRILKAEPEKLAQALEVGYRLRAGAIDKEEAAEQVRALLPEDSRERLAESVPLLLEKLLPRQSAPRASRRGTPVRER